MSLVIRLGALVLFACGLGLGVRPRQCCAADAQAIPQTPIRYLVVISESGASFDHYFGTYPMAANPGGEPSFTPPANTPAIDGLTADLLNRNPNLAAPFRLDRSQAVTCRARNGYAEEQQAYNGGAADRFVQTNTDVSGSAAAYCPQNDQGENQTVMGYFDGNTVTALWNYAAHFASSDNYFATTFGAAMLGGLHLIAADTSGVLCGPPAAAYGSQPLCGSATDTPPDTTSTPAPGNGSTGTLVAEGEPFWEACAQSPASGRIALSGLNIGDLLDGAGVSWGWFQGGFALSADGTCTAQHVQEAADRSAGIDPATDPNATADYDATREPFQLFASSANPQHLAPDSVTSVGHDDAANHQYDLFWFWQAADAGNLPSVSFIEPPAYQDGRAETSNPLDQQQFLVETINRLQRLPQWNDMAVIVTWDDSGGWYDHAAPRNVSQSSTPLDFGCGNVTSGPPARCAYGPRLPILAISPFAKQGYVSHALLDQTSITRFIEDNWLGGQRLSPTSFDRIAGSLLDLFQFTQPALQPLNLDSSSGEPAP
jgi:phospholipase C